MGKINFTKEHMARLRELATDMLFANNGIQTTFGVLNVVDLLHTTTINSLNSIKMSLIKAIEIAENVDEWTKTDAEQQKLDMLKTQKEFVNLVVGYKRYNDELKTIAKQKHDLEKQIAALEEAEKTPADKLKELRAALDELNSDEF